MFQRAFFFGAGAGFILSPHPVHNRRESEANAKQRTSPMRASRVPTCGAIRKTLL